jgi:hypothetical protein
VMPEYRSKKRPGRPKYTFPLGAVGTGEEVQIDLPVKKSNKPTVTKIVIKRTLEDQPDLSYLGDFTNDYEKAEEGDIVIDRFPEGEPRGGEYRYFIAHNVSNDKEARDNYARVMQFVSGQVGAYIISAEAYILVPDGRGNFMTQTISSGSIGGIDTDSDESYIKETEDEQIAELQSQLKAFGIKDLKGVPVEKSENE